MTTDNMVQFPLRLPEGLIAWLKKEGQLHKVPPSVFVRRLIKREAGELPSDAVMWQQEINPGQLVFLESRDRRYQDAYY